MYDFCPPMPQNAPAMRAELPKEPELIRYEWRQHTGTASMWYRMPDGKVERRDVAQKNWSLG